MDSYDKKKKENRTVELIFPIYYYSKYESFLFCNKHSSMLKNYSIYLIIFTS